jgi:hypothetical protein
MSFVLLTVMLLLALGVSRRAVLTQPPITKIEEMGGLVH